MRSKSKIKKAPYNKTPDHELLLDIIKVSKKLKQFKPCPG